MRGHSTVSTRWTRLALAAVAPLFFALSCTENLPNGPNTFGATIKISVPHDTLVVGDSSVAQAVATDANGRTIQSLFFTWTSADPTIVAIANPAAAAADNASGGRTMILIGRDAGAPRSPLRRDERSKN